MPLPVPASHADERHSRRIASLGSSRNKLILVALGLLFVASLFYLQGSSFSRVYVEVPDQPLSTPSSSTDPSKSSLETSKTLSPTEKSSTLKPTSSSAPETLKTSSPTTLGSSPTTLGSSPTTLGSSPTTLGSSPLLDAFNEPKAIRFPSSSNSTLHRSPSNHLNASNSSTNPLNPSTNPLNPSVLYERPDENMFVDLTMVSLRCDGIHSHLQTCLDFLDQHSEDYLVRRKSNLPKCDSEHPMIFHAYWRGLIGDGLVWILKSFIYTQRLDCARYILWTEGYLPLDIQEVEALAEKEESEKKAAKSKPAPPVPPSNTKYPKINMTTHLRSLKELKKMAPYVEVRRFVLAEEVKKTNSLTPLQWEHYLDHQALKDAAKLVFNNPSASKDQLEHYMKLNSTYKWFDEERNLAEKSKNVSTNSKESTKSSAKKVSTNSKESSISSQPSSNPSASIPSPRFKWPSHMMDPKAVLNANAVSDSDTVRFILLYNYGGIYVDTDVLFLRDMRPWYYTPKTWSSSWGYQDNYNTALVKSEVKDPSIAFIIDKGLSSGSAKFHPFEILKYLNGSRPKSTISTSTSNNGAVTHVNSLAAESLLSLIPSGVFDTSWPMSEGHSDPFLPKIMFGKPLFSSHSDREIEFSLLTPSLGVDFIRNGPIRSLRTLQNFLPGSPAYHTHGIGYLIEPNSWVDILLNHYDCFLSRLCTNIYNEHYPSPPPPM